jgi:hypothetical protein
VISALTEDVLINFIAYCQSLIGLKFSTIKLYLAGVRHFGITYANRNPLVDQYRNQLLRLHNVLQSVKNSDLKSAGKKLPITYVLLAKMFNYLKNGIFNDVTDLVLQTACVVAFFGFLRCRQFTCKTNFDSNIHLCIGDIDFASHDCVKLFLKTSKTDVYRQGVYIKLLKTDSDLCPYKLLRKLIMNRKSSIATEKDPLFVEEHNIALFRKYFMSKLKTLLSYLDFVHSDYSGHSFRIGAATTCASNGIQDHMIQTLGRWKSNCLMRYIRMSNRDIIYAQKMMCH